MTEDANRSGIVVKMVIVVILAAAVGAVVVIKQNDFLHANQEQAVPEIAATSEETTEIAPESLPKLLDLGATKCIPCKKMMPILESMKEEYKGRLDVEFIDVWEHTNASRKYGIKLIPTQIFFDAQGKELFRHEGFFSKEDILAKWKELGFTFSGSEKQETESDESSS